jgi:hypothetical protein
MTSIVKLPETPETIYLIEDEEGFVWCDDPNPTGSEDNVSIRYMKMPITVAKGTLMPPVEQHYQANAIRDQELILEQRDEIGRLNARLNKLVQLYTKARKRNG